MGRYLDLVPYSLKASAGVSDGEIREIREIREESIADPHRELVRAMLAKVRDQPVGMIPWLEQNRPVLYEELAVRLPDKIHRLWGRAPLAEFERILDIWLEAHRTGCELYQKAQAEGAQH